VKRLPGLRVPGAFDGFELAVRVVLGQQVSVKAATTMAGRWAARSASPSKRPGPKPAYRRPRPRLACSPVAEHEIGRLASLAAGRDA